ncbi:MAG: glycine zipper 2TM domain-containing protein [Casimicrobiaceae bacterium]
MKILNQALAGVFAAAAIVGGTANAQVIYDSTPRYVQTSPAAVGTVESIEALRGGDNRGNKVAGTILGGVIGGVIGHQFGSGRGNDAATVAGVVGGAAVGHEIGESRGGRESGYRVNVRMDNGGTRTFFQGDVYGLNVGDRVQVDNGYVIRVANNSYRDDNRAYRAEDRIRTDDGAYRDNPGYRYDSNGYRISDEPVARYAQGGRLDRRIYHYDGQGYRVDQWGNRYDAEGYWVDELGNRHEYQDPPMPDDPPNRATNPQ